MTKPTSRPGRPDSAPSTSGFSIGIERVLTRAVLEPRFRELLFEDRDAALAASGVALSSTERHIIGAISTPALLDAIERARGPKASRRGFIRAVSGTLVAALATGASAGCEGVEGAENDAAIEDRYQISCDGSRPDPPTCETNVPGGDYWIYLGGTSVFLHLPPSYSPWDSLPLCLAFHDHGQSNLSMVELWKETADQHGFALAAAEWEGTEGAITSRANSLRWWASTLDEEYCVRTWSTVITGVGTGGTLALQAALFGSPQGYASYSHAISFGGPLPGDWQSQTLVNPAETRAYVAMSPLDPRYQATHDDLVSLSELGVTCDLVQAHAVDPPYGGQPDPAWQWIGLG